MHFENGTIVNDRFMIMNKLGSGGFGDAYMAHDREDDTIVAIKTISDLRYEPNSLVNEASALFGLSHKNIIQIKEFSAKNGYGCDCVVTEYVPGMDLRSFAHYKNYRKPLEVMLQIIQQIIEGMIYLESQNILHRDLKPDNIILTEWNEIKILDFGLTKRMHDNPDYEMNKYWHGHNLFADLYSAKYDVQSDMYSLGITIFYLLTLKLPGYQLPEDISDFYPDYEGMEKLNNIFINLTHPDRNQRFKSFKEVKESFTEAIKGIKKREVKTEFTPIKLYNKEFDFESNCISLEKLIEELNRFDFHDAPMNRCIDGIWIEYALHHSNTEIFFAFRCFERKWKIHGDCRIGALYKFLVEAKRSTQYGYINPEEFLVIHELPDGNTALRLRSNFNPQERRHRAGGFYCYDAETYK